MSCPKCKQSNQPERNYCGKCGTPLMQYCRLCGFRNQAADMYCGGCGGGLTGESRPCGQSVDSFMEEGTSAIPEFAENSALAELLEVAQRGAEVQEESQEIKVSQDDIDSLFGD